MTERPKCPECQNIMAKNGKRWVGRRKAQKWMCSKCGRQIETRIENNFS